MLLDHGVVSIFRRKDMALSGEMPRPGFDLVAMGWYGELNFETSPYRQTEGREEQRTDARIRILQNRMIRQDDVAVLCQLTDFRQKPEGQPVYRITRAWHGTSDTGPDLITDLTLEVTQP